VCVCVRAHASVSGECVSACAWMVVGCTHNLDSELTIAADGSAHITELPDSCPAHGVCSWARGVDACDQQAAGVPQVGLRCVKASRSTPARVEAAMAVAAGDRAEEGEPPGTAGAAASPAEVEPPPAESEDAGFELVPDGAESDENEIEDDRGGSDDDDARMEGML
jgi:hypothetical protein